MCPYLDNFNILLDKCVILSSVTMVIDTFYDDYYVSLLMNELLSI